MTPEIIRDLSSPEDECQCGDYRKHHVLGRGNCLICRDGTPPPDGADGCQRFRLAFTAGTRMAVLNGS